MPPSAQSGVVKEEEEEEAGLKGAAGAAWDGVFQEGGQWFLDGQVRGVGWFLVC